MHWVKRGKLGTATLACAAAAACGGQSEGSASATGPHSEQAAACEAFAAALCARREACAAPSGGTGKRFASEASCRERYTLACHEWAELLKRSINVELAACVPALNLATCQEITDVFWRRQADVPECLRTLGTQPSAAPCRSEVECESGRCSSATACGTCTPPVDPQILSGLEGEACNPRSCEPYLSCEAGICRSLPCDEPGCHDWGRACSGINGPRSDCPQGTECLNQSDMGNGLCLAYAADGEACAHWAGPPCLFPARCIDARCTLPSERRCP